MKILKEILALYLTKAVKCGILPLVANKRVRPLHLQSILALSQRRDHLEYDRLQHFKEG